MTPNISSDLSATTSTVSSIEWKTIRISFPTRKALSRQLCLFDPALMTIKSQNTLLVTLRSSIVEDIFVLFISFQHHLHELLPPAVNPNNVAGNRHSFSHKRQDDDPSKEDEEKTVLFNETATPCAFRW